MQYVRTDVSFAEMRLESIRQRVPTIWTAKLKPAVTSKPYRSAGHTISQAVMGPQFTLAG